jgi:hypothetical protein
MNKNDKHLLKQMIEAGRFNYSIYELLCESNKQNSVQMIKKMGTKWCCHSDNATKRLDIPLSILPDRIAAKVLRKKP